ncbi:MAG: response regulator [Flavobacteriaceae bacterium]
MKKKFNRILLVDDDSATNFLHSMILKQLDCADEIVAVENGLQALKYLQRAESGGEFPRPDLILLDINMPRMNGWEFLKEYIKLESRYWGGKILLMLTASLSTEEMELAENTGLIHGFIKKPMTKTIAQKLIDDHA